MGSSSLFAETVSIKKVKCSLFGNLKIKVSGLESYGRIGRMTLMANIPLRTDCKSEMNDFLGSVSRSRSHVSADLDTRIIYRQVDNNDDKGRRCIITERKTLSVVFDTASSYVFKAMTTKDIGNHRGSCRRF